MDKYFTTVSESKLLTVPGMQPLRKQLLEAALEYYEGFVKQRGSDLSIQSALAETYFRVGRINAFTGKGKTTLTDAEQAERRGYADQAMDALRQAVANGFKDSDRLR